jgi:hypothetical protein
MCESRWYYRDKATAMLDVDELDQTLVADVIKWRKLEALEFTREYIKSLSV